MSDAIFADPHEPGNGHCPDAQDEGQQIYNKLRQSPGPYHIEHGFNSTEFLRDSQNRENIHFAGHGQYDTTDGPGLRFNNRTIYKGDIQRHHKPSKLFFASSCKSYHDSQLVDHYLNQGSRSFIGYKDSPPSDKAKNFAIEFYNEWVLNQKSSEDAFTDSLTLYRALQGNVQYKQINNNPVYY